jgi:hypothetical protein
MGVPAKPEFFGLLGVEHDGAILNEPEAKHQHCAAFEAALALPPVEPR